MNSKIRWAVETLHLALLAWMFVVAAWVWPILPKLLPVHWTGLPPAIPWRVDGYGGKFQALLLWPLLVLGFYLLMRSAPQWSDRYQDLGGTLGFATLRFATTALLASNFFATVLMYEGYRVDIFAVDRIGLLILLSICVGAFVWQLFREHLQS